MEGCSILDPSLTKKSKLLYHTFQKDQKCLEKYNITYNQIANKLYYIIKKIVDLKHNLPIDDIYEIVNIKEKTSLRCPLQTNNQKYNNMIIHIKNIQTCDELKFSTFLHHLIENHHFFGAPGTKYRIKPKNLIKFFNLNPLVNYISKPNSRLLSLNLENKSDLEWAFESYSDLNVGIIDILCLEKVALKKYDFDKYTTGFLFPTNKIDNSVHGLVYKNLKVINHNNFDSWEKVREYFLRYKHSSQREINKQIEYEMELVNKYKYIGSVEQLYLWVFCFKRGYTFEKNNSIAEGIHFEHLHSYSLTKYICQRIHN